MADQRPNIILFTTDQHRGDHLSIAGHPVVETPNVDSFVQHGAYFPNAYTEFHPPQGRGVASTAASAAMTAA